MSETALTLVICRRVFPEFRVQVEEWCVINLSRVLVHFESGEDCSSSLFGLLQAQICAAQVVPALSPPLCAAYVRRTSEQPGAKSI